MEARIGRGVAALDPHEPLTVAHQGYTVLVAGPAGDLDPGAPEGLFDYDTRIVAAHRLRFDGRIPDVVSTQKLAPHVWAAFMRVPMAGGVPGGPGLPQDLLGVQVVRRVGSGMDERITVRNHSMTTVATELALELDADFADLLDVLAPRRGGVPRRAPSGEETPTPTAQESARAVGTSHVAWDAARRELLFEHTARSDGREMDRAVRIKVLVDEGEPRWDAGALRFRLQLAPRGVWALRLEFASRVDGRWRSPHFDPARPLLDAGASRQQLVTRWHDRRTRLEVAGVEPSPFCEAARDLIALRAWEQDDDADAWVPNAGVPAGTGLFGRDALIAGWQAALLGPEMMRGALGRLAATQASDDVPVRDEEPGRLVQEMRRGPLAELGLTPLQAYYGANTTIPAFALALSELWHWTGDVAAIARWSSTLLSGLDWLEKRGDVDGDGFVESVTRSPVGRMNQGWKDSDEAMRHPDGTPVGPPLATIEDQSYHVLALSRAAEILFALGQDGQAERMLERARLLRERIDRAFWMDDKGCYALALDAGKSQVRTVASNAGHALLAGVVPADRAVLVARRLLSPDLYSGWGVRSLSSRHPSYNPFAYHLGAVSPAENAIIATGMKRYGLDHEVERVATGLVEAARAFRNGSLPELLAGTSREEWPLPIAYPHANCPQAWSASALIQLVTAMLGVMPFAPARLVALVRPRLPVWLPELTLRRLRVGDGWLTLRFHRRRDGGADHEVIERAGRLLVVTVAPPQEATGVTSFDEDVKDWLLAHVPGRNARQIRLMFGQLD